MDFTLFCGKNSFISIFTVSLQNMFCPDLRTFYVEKNCGQNFVGGGKTTNIMYARVFQKWHFVKEKNCNTSTHPSGVYINQIQKNFFPKTSLEGQTTWSKMVKID